MHNLLRFSAIAAMALSICVAARSHAFSATLPAKPEAQSVVLAGGCFWGVQAVFEHTKGVMSATSGYAGGKADTAQYETVSTGTTGHAESVKVTFDPSQISLAQILDIYFTVAHDPTQLNAQGPDVGTQYRSEIFTSSDAQRQQAQAAIAKLEAAKRFNAPIVTKIEPLQAFYPAEDYHQHYAALNPYNPYIMIHDAPKVALLKSSYPSIYRE